MSFVDPLNLYSYGAAPPMVQPQLGVDPFAMDPYFAMQPQFAADPFMAMQSQYAVDPYMAGGMGIDQMSYGYCDPYSDPYAWGAPPPPPPQQDAGISGIIKQFMNMMVFALLILKKNKGNNDLPPQDFPLMPADGPVTVEEDDDIAVDETEETDETDETEEEPELDEDAQEVEDLEPTEALDALSILETYWSDLPGKSNGLTRTELRKISKDKELPEKVRTAADTIYNNKTVYNLLCIKGAAESTTTGVDAAQGFKSEVLDHDWEDSDVALGELEDPSGADAISTIMAKKVEIAKLNSDTSFFTLKELRQIALGTVGDSTLKTAEMQSAAIKILTDDSLRKELGKKLAEAKGKASTDHGDGTKFWGDPHFVGEDGEEYDVMGESGKTYNILTDKYIQYNGKFAKWGTGDNGSNIEGAKDMTVVDQAGIKIGNSNIYFDRTGEAPKINDQAMEVNKEYDVGNGTKATWDGTKLIIDTPEYVIELEVKTGEENGVSSKYIDSNVKAKFTDSNGNGTKDADERYVTNRDGVASHGLLGQTIDDDNDKKNNGQDLGKQGGSVIDGTYKDYEVSDGLFGTGFKYNRYVVDANYDAETEFDAGN